MSGYADGDTKILTVIRGHANYSTANTASADWRILDSGNDVRYAITKPAPAERVKHTMATTLDIFTTVVEMWAFMKSEQSDEGNASDLYGEAKAIADRIETFNRLGDTADTILLARVKGIAEPQEMFNSDGALQWLMQEISVEWQEERTPVYQDV